MKVLKLNDRNDVLDVRVDSDVGGGKMRALAHAGQRGREHLMTACAKPARDRRPLPRTTETTVDDDERRHVGSVPHPGAPV